MYFQLDSDSHDSRRNDATGLVRVMKFIPDRAILKSFKTLAFHECFCLVLSRYNIPWCLVLSHPLGLYAGLLGHTPN